jgi:hypothetical protein
MSSEIKNKILDKIELLKIGDENDILLANEMKKNIKDIECFYCFDTKQLWGYRNNHHVFWSRFAFNFNRFWVGQCNKCGEQKFLYDTDSNEIIIGNQYKLFFIDDSTSTSRINELIRVSKKVVNENNNNHIIKNETLVEEPDYEVEASVLEQKITKVTLSADIKKISQILGAVLEAHVGIPNFDLLKKIELSISFESSEKKKEQVFYKSSDKNDYFIFVIIKHVVEDKNGNILSIFNGEKHKTKVLCYYWIYKTKNQAAIDICKKKIKDAVENELNFMSEILKLQHNKNISK